MKSLLAITILLVNFVIIYFGRIYFPINFSPSEVSFFENYTSLLLTECFTIFVIFCFYSLFKFIYNDLKNLLIEVKNKLNN